jgi:hypothetical protein
LPRATQTQPQVPSLSSLAPLHLLCNLSHTIPNCICFLSHLEQNHLISFSSFTAQYQHLDRLLQEQEHTISLLRRAQGLYSAAIHITVQSNKDEDRIVQHQVRQNQPIPCLSLWNHIEYNCSSINNPHRTNVSKSTKLCVGILTHYICPCGHELFYFLRFSLRHCLIQSHPTQSRTSSAIQLQFQSELFCLVLTKHQFPPRVALIHPKGHFGLQLASSFPPLISLHCIRSGTLQPNFFVSCTSMHEVRSRLSFTSLTRLDPGILRNVHLPLH